MDDENETEILKRKNQLLESLEEFTNYKELVIEARPKSLYL